MRVTLAAVVICAVFFVLQLAVPGFTEFFALTPAVALSGAYWQFITYIFLHGSFMHIFLNMFVLIMFGPIVERKLGTYPYLALFFLSGLGSAFLHIAITQDSFTILLGASGAIFGILTAYGFLYPKNWIIMFPGIPIPAVLAVFLFAGIELFYGVSGLEAGVANFGHLGGILTGIIFMLLWKYTRKSRAFEPFRANVEYFWE